MCGAVNGRRQNRSECSKGEIGEGDERIGTTLMKMLATIQLEFESAGETTHNAMDAALIRGLGALKKGIELRETGGPRISIRSGSTKWNILSVTLS
jgi:hypothetical protein